MALQTPPKPLSWEELISLPYASLKSIDQEHQALLAGPIDKAEGIAGLHFLALRPEKDISDDEIYKAIIQSIQDRTGSLTLGKEALGNEPLRFSRKRQFNTGTDLLNRGHFIEQIFAYPNARIRTFHLLSNDPTRARRIASAQRLLHDLHQYVRSTAAGNDHLESFSTREPIRADDHGVHNLYLDASDLKTRLAKSPVDERVALINQTTAHDLALHAHSRSYFGTESGTSHAQLPGTWKTLWRNQPLLSAHDPSLELLEGIILKADHHLAGQLKEDRLLDGKGKLLNGAASMLSKNPHIKAVIDLIGINKKVRGPLGFSMGDLNAGNVMVYSDGKQEFVDFEDARLEDAASLLFPRWVGAGIYSSIGKPLKFGEESSMGGANTTESYLLRQAQDELSKLPGGAPTSEQFENDFHTRKSSYLLRIARRFKNFETIDANPERMRALKRYYFTWFVNDVTERKKVGSDHPGIQYLSTLFETPLSTQDMEKIYSISDPAFTYRSELSPREHQIRAEITEDLETRRKALQKNKRRQKMMIGGLMGLTVASAVSLTLLAGTTMRVIDQNTQFAQKIETVEKELTTEREEKSYTSKVAIAKKFHHFESGYDSVEVYELNHLSRWVDRFWPSDPANRGFLAYENPRDSNARLRHPEWTGTLKTAYAAYIDWESTKRGLLATHCTNWDCELGTWIENHGFAKDRDSPPSIGLVSPGTRLYLAMRDVTGGYIDNWAWHPDPSRSIEIKNKTVFMGHPVFGQGHHCKTFEIRKEK